MGRSVYCRWCYERGHNRRTCPEYTKRLKERAEAEVKGNEERDVKNNWSQIEYAKRIKADTLLDGTPYDRPVQTNGTGTRRCSYCGERGHNRRSCEAFAVRKDIYVKDLIKYRKDILKTIEKKGLGPGALITVEPRYPRDYDEERNHLYMITEIMWEYALHSSPANRAIRTQALELDEDGNAYRGSSAPFPKPHNHKNDPDKDDWQQKYSENDNFYEHVNIVSPVATKGIKRTVPADWYERSSIEKSEYFKTYFKDARSHDYWDNFYND